MSSGFGPPKAFIIPFAVVGSLVIIGAIITALHRCGHTFGFSSFERRNGGRVGPTRFEVDRPGGLNGTVLPGPFYPPALASNALMSGVPNSTFQSQGYNYQTSVPQAQPPPQSYYPVQQYQPPSPNPLLALNPLLQNQPRGTRSAPIQTPMSTAPTITPFIPTRPSSRATARDVADLEAARGSYYPSAYGMGGSEGANAHRAGGLPPSYESTWEENPRR